VNDDRDGARRARTGFARSLIRSPGLRCGLSP
jgi:hypothetical protein